MDDKELERLEKKNSYTKSEALALIAEVRRQQQEKTDKEEEYSRQSIEHHLAVTAKNEMEELVRKVRRGEL